MTSSATDVVVDGLTKVFESDLGSVRAVDNASFRIPAGSFFTLLGPSGCGKTTLLRCLAGLVSPSAGSIRVGDDVFVDVIAGVDKPVNRRDIGMVFQSYAIWPHLSVHENIAFPLKVNRRSRRYSDQEVRKKVNHALEIVDLPGLGSRPATDLSGGQQQRVALARAIVGEPKLLILDEPLSNLDARLRDRMRVEILRIQQELAITTVYVTHDQTEALSMSDEIAVIQKGIIVQKATPEDIYRRPSSAFVASFIGSRNLVTAVVEPPSSNTRVGAATRSVRTSADLRAIGVAVTDHGLGSNTSCLIGIRPEAIEIAPREAPATGRSGESGSKGAALSAAWAGIVQSALFMGAHTEYVVDVSGTLLHARVAGERRCARGQQVQVSWPVEECLIFPETGEQLE